ncbi:AcrR family transcriptional regulator [Rhizobium sp. SG_E_25_P2]|uniref:TetR/AcrR family transcriptional regulator n=1 Tax=Rhizobium sp. SG_E_25_P2 TaxID=2879942 RepID=UPI0024737AE1|nr:TetR/AcrR family transcriptional regulator [Rhizobium sp. SG_E_25_P2]MDH6265983.1 AcrR family transcriptional regulator [Rhizobium sp. SG_E_25_P2]
MKLKMEDPQAVLGKQNASGKGDVAPGKRKQNAAMLRRKILEAARSLFGEIGYEPATISKIRQRANVSIATFYKYFDSKQTLLVAILNDEHEIHNADIALALAAVIKDPVTYVVSVIFSTYDMPRDEKHKAMWREIIGASVLLSGDRKSAATVRSDRQLYTSIMKQVLNRLVDEAFLDTKCPVEDICDVIYDIGAFEFQEFISDEYTDEDAFWRHIYKLINTVLSLWIRAR